MEWSASRLGCSSLLLPEASQGSSEDGCPVLVGVAGHLETLQEVTEVGCWSAPGQGLTAVVQDSDCFLCVGGAVHYSTVQ